MGCLGYDGVVGIGGCDKNMPGVIIGLARLNRPSLFIYGGSIMRVNYEPVGYNVASVGLGCTLRLKGAQITKLVEGTNATSGFEKVEPVVHNDY